MKSIVLPCLVHTQKTIGLMNLDLDYKLTDCELKSIRFYQISAIAEYKEDGVTYTEIHANGGLFYSSHWPDEVDRLIKENL